jgi:hypothetical protein
MRVLDLAVKLAVGERAGAALAELHVRFRIEHRLAPEAPGVLGALAHRPAALQNDRTKAHLGEHQCGEQAARTGADDDGSCGIRRSVRDEAVAGVGRERNIAVTRKPPEQRTLVPHRDVEGIDQRDCGFLARVDAAPEHRKAGQVVRPDAQAPQHRSLEFGLAMIERQFQFGQAQHGRILLDKARRDSR